MSSRNQFKKSKKRNYASTGGSRTTGHSNSANNKYPVNGFYGAPQPMIGAPNGLYNSRYAVPSRGPEKKFIDTFQAPTKILKGYGTTDAPAGFVLLNGIKQGTDFTERIGRTICMKSITVNYSAAILGQTFTTAPIDPNTVVMIGASRQELSYGVRWMVVLDRQPNGVLAGINDLLWNQAYTDGVTGNAIVNTTAFNNLNNKDRFLVIYDKKYTLTSQGGTGGIYAKKFRKLNTEVQYNASTGRINDIQTGALYFLAFCDATNRTDDVNTEFSQPVTLPSVGTVKWGLYHNWRVRVRYTDV